MRYNTPIYFQYVTPGEYDANTGDYGPDVVTEVMKRADVTDSTTETLKFVYGEIKHGCKTIRLQQSFRDAFDRIRIFDELSGKDRLYHVDKDMLKKRVFVAREV